MSDTAALRDIEKDFRYPPEASAGHMVRNAHRAFQRELEKEISVYGISRGQWYFLRALWIEDGLTQRELSERVGMMEPTTVVALAGMEKAKLIRRRRSTADRRKVLVYLTPKGEKLRDLLLPVAKSVSDRAAAGVSREDLAAFHRVLARMIANLDSEE
jgi:DNA-binding MarR family transcriptional regulator